MSRRTLTSVRNAARLLKAFTAHDPALGVTDLAERLELGKSTVHRMLTTLLEEGLVEQDQRSGQYRLGLAAIELGAAMSSASDLHHAVLLPMTALRLRTGETVQTSVLDGRQVVYVERLESPHTLRLFLEVGRRNDAHCTGSGKCLLAFLPEARLDAVLGGWELPRQTEHTITHHDVLRRELHDIRHRGYAENLHESEVGVISVAAPIRSPSREVIAALSVAGPADRLEPDLHGVRQAVVEAAAIATKRLRPTS